MLVAAIIAGSEHTVAWPPAPAPAPAACEIEPPMPPAAAAAAIDPPPAAGGGCELDMGPAEATEAMLLWKSPRGVAADPRLLLVGDSMLLLSPPSKAEEAAAAAAVGEAMTTGQAERKPAEGSAEEGMRPCTVLSVLVQDVVMDVGGARKNVPHGL